MLIVPNDVPATTGQQAAHTEERVGGDFCPQQRCAQACPATSGRVYPHSNHFLPPMAIILVQHHGLLPGLLQAVSLLLFYSPTVTLSTQEPDRIFQNVSQITLSLLQTSSFPSQVEAEVLATAYKRLHNLGTQISSPNSFLSRHSSHPGLHAIPPTYQAQSSSVSLKLPPPGLLLPLDRHVHSHLKAFPGYSICNRHYSTPSHTHTHTNTLSILLL